MCYSISEIELILGISRPSVLKLLNKNEFKWFKIGTVYRISKPSFEEWMQKTL
ncbi:MAG: helix-turn-helix domain-containing protein [Subdoligranulum variabile]|nr:helix-turn-helix domain-containing protein [Subdoligranulum variabile]